MLVSHLFPPASLLDAAMQNLRLPALETLLARGRRHACPAQGPAAALGEVLGMVRQQDWPLAPISVLADGGVPRDAYWLRADPVHLQVMRDRIVLTDSATLELSEPEAQALAASIRTHFGENLAPIVLHPQRWYIECPRPPDLITTPLSIATGRDIDPLLPHGADAMRFRALLNEVQMLLFEHPVNQAREARGQLAVNALWLWGGGVVPDAPQTQVAVYASDDESKALCHFCNAPLYPVPTRLDKATLQNECVVVLEDLIAAGHCGDSYGWRQVMIAMEKNWFVPLLSEFRNIGSNGLVILDPINGSGLKFKRMDAWKLWRRNKALNAHTVD